VLAQTEDDGCSEALALLYRVRLLGIEGFGPRVRGCGRCGGEANAFHPGEGAVMCASCSPRSPGAVALSAGSVKLYEALATWELAKVGRLRAGAAMLAELGAVLDAHLAHVLTRRERKTASQK
jgi:DNA repair protein RecO (recombination protein O)